ncbi:hypothetical protein CXF46_10990 [Corynebacterium bovis]|nr:hypothetical protein CXF46_10990 [Corynebacterium bovis]
MCSLSGGEPFGEACGVGGAGGPGLWGGSEVVGQGQVCGVAAVGLAVAVVGESREAFFCFEVSSDGVGVVEAGVFEEVSDDSEAVGGGG